MFLLVFLINIYYYYTNIITQRFLYLINNLMFLLFFNKIKKVKINSNFINNFITLKNSNNFFNIFLFNNSNNFFYKSLNFFIAYYLLKIYKIFFLRVYQVFTVKSFYSFYSFYLNSSFDNVLHFYKFFNKIYFIKKFIKSKKKNFFFINNLFFNLNDKFINLENKIKLLKKKLNNFIFLDFNSIKISTFISHKTNCNTKLIFFSGKLDLSTPSKNIFNKFFKKNLLKYKNKKKKYFNFYKKHEKIFDLPFFKKKVKFIRFNNVFYKNDLIFYHFRFIFVKNLYYNNSFFLKISYTNKLFFFNNFNFKNSHLKKNNNKHKSVIFKKYFITYLLINDFYFLNKHLSYKNNFLPFSSNFYLNNLSLIDYSKKNLDSLKSSEYPNSNYFYTNYYPVFFVNLKPSSPFFKKFKANFDIDYINYMQFSTINYLEFFLRKRIFLKVSNNFFKKCESLSTLKRIFENYKSYRPKYMKNFLISDLFELIWYSFFLKDLSFMSKWISKFMEITSFKNHKKFLMFFQNFVKRYANVFIDVLKIKGFFFDIRGKVGVTGSSKKRHISFKIGNLGKSNKNSKIEFNQNLVRTYSGVLGVTYVLSY